MQDLTQTGPEPVLANAERDAASRRVALLEGQVRQLQDRVAGLVQALETRAGLEQAKGVLAERHGWTTERAFEQISMLSQNTNTRVHDLARVVVAQTTAPRAVDPATLAWACRLLDLLPCTALLLTPLYGESGVDAAHGSPETHTAADAATHSSAGITDFRVDYANPATVDLEGRTPEQVVGRRLSRIWPGAVASGLAERYAGVLASGEPYSCDAQPLAELVGGEIITTTLRLRVMPFLGGVLVLWQDDEDNHRTHPLSPARPDARRRRR